MRETGGEPGEIPDDVGREGGVSDGKMEVFFLIKEITKSILLTSSIKGKSEKAYRFMKERYGECTVGLAVNDPEGRKLYDCFYYENDECLDFEDVLYSEGGSSKLLKTVLTRREWIYDTESTDGPTVFVGLAPSASYFAPLEIEGKTIGAFTYQVHDRERFSWEELEVCRELVPFMTIALNNTIQSARIMRANRMLERYSKYDELTGIYNRRFFYEVFDEIYRGARRRGEEVYAYILDLDKFKEVNDNFGHSAGDEVLKRVSHMLCRVFEKGEVGRYGGDEFLCGISGISRAGAEKLAQTVVEEVVGMGVPCDDSGGRVGVSVGILKLSQDKPLRDYFSELDNNLYRVKKNGGGGFFLS